MKLLTDWGFDSNWQKGERGEYWVLAQGVLLVGFFLLPIYRPALGSIPYSLLLSLLLLSIALGLFGVLFIIKGVWDLRHSITPLPYPRSDGELIQSGVYGIVRHPIYTGVIFAALGWAIYQLSVSHGLGAIALLLFFNAKASREEQWLREKYADYAVYSTAVKKLIPWLY